MDNKEQKRPGLYTAGLVLGIIALCMFLNPIIAFICGMLALIFGAVTYNKVKKKAPIILGLLGMIIAITEVVLLIVFMGQIKDSLRDKGKKVIKNAGTEFVETVKEEVREQKDDLSDETKEDINEAIRDVEDSLRESFGVDIR